ncbi:hypothetical protein PTKIN_Ptkin17bG0101700 [Pterospermum kingtungense]
MAFPLGPFVRVNLQDNHLEGSIPHWSNVTNLSLKNNLFSGLIPSNIGHEMSLLQNLDLSGNMLNGSIPLSINNMTYLNSLDLSSNKLSGTIPGQWPGLQYLMFLDLSKNNLSGDHIPSSMCSLPSLRWLKLSSNNFGGDLSTFLQYCKVHFSLDLGENKFTGSIPESIAATESPMELLSLRANMLTGSIPEKLCQLFNLLILDLAQNDLSGSIPTCLGSFPRLKTSNQFYFKPYPTTLDMSMTFDNHMELVIKGRESPIPPSISKLTFLSHLNLSYNNLSGQIPSSNQLQTIGDPSIYEGNQGRCGPPLSISCSISNDAGDAQNKDGDNSITLEFYVNAILGFIAAFWATFGTLVIKKSFIHAYFRFLDKKKDELSVLILVNVARLRRKIRMERN